MASIQMNRFESSDSVQEDEEEEDGKEKNRPRINIYVGSATNTEDTEG